MKKQALKIGLINSYKGKSKEFDSTIKFLKSEKSIKYTVLTLEKLIKIHDLKNHFDCLWWHYDENVDLPENVYSHRVKESISNFVEMGGGLLLSLLASQYVYDLELETQPPDIIYKGKWEKLSWVENFPDIRGFQGFRNHSIFKDIYNGAYTWNPKKGEGYSESYYSADCKHNGKCIAKGRGYISLNEDLNLVNEYNFGKGKILTIGSYLFFSTISDRFRTELKFFTLNCLNYLANRISGIENSYWPIGKFGIERTPDESTKFNLKLNEVSPQESELKFSGKSSENYIGLSGRRTLLTGRENGGIDEIWFHPFRALKDYHFFIEFNGNCIRDNQIQSDIIIQPESIQRKYKTDNGTINELIFTTLDSPGVVAQYKINLKNPVDFVIEFLIDFRYMWPYSSNLFGEIKYNWDNGLKCLVISTLDKTFCLNIGAGMEPSNISTEIITIENIKSANVEKEQSFVRFKLNFSLKKGVYSFPLLVTGSNMGWKESFDVYKKLFNNLKGYYEEQYKYYKRLIENSTIIDSPDTNFNEGYKWALIGTDKFFIETKPLGKSLCAGYNKTKSGWGDGRPGYAWYFGRDSVWTSFALLKYGDFEKVKEVLGFLVKYQNVDGKIFHELTTSGCVHYDAADSTPLFIILCGYYFRATGDVKFIKSIWENIEKAVHFCFTTDSDEDHLIENTNVGHGWLEGGYLFPQHEEIYLEACWSEALKESSYIAKKLGLKKISAEYEKESKIIKGIINKYFWNKEAQFFDVGEQADGSFTEEKTSLVAVPLLFNIAETEKALKVLYEYAGSNFSTDWGTRIIREDNKAFKPTGYHYGAIWPLFTGWISLAEYKYYRGIQGFTHMMNNLLIYKYWSKGYIQEVINGEEFLPSGVCPHQAWSESMVLQPALEGMIGIQTDSVNNTLSLSPNFPANWDSATVKNIKFGKEKINFSYKRTKGKYVFELNKKTGSAIKVVFSPHILKGMKIEKVLIDKKPGKYTCDEIDETRRLGLNLKLKNKSLVEVFYSGGVQVLPFIQKLHPGCKSRGLRIIKDVFRNNEYKILLEGKRENTYVFQIYSDSLKIDEVEQAKIITRKNNIYDLEIEFEDSKNKYYEKEVVIKLLSDIHI